MSMMIAFASPLSYVYIPKLRRLTLQLLIVSSYNTFCTHFVDIQVGENNLKAHIKDFYSIDACVVAIF